MVEQGGSGVEGLAVLLPCCLQGTQREGRVERTSGHLTGMKERPMVAAGWCKDTQTNTRPHPTHDSQAHKNGSPARPRSRGRVALRMARP